MKLALRAFAFVALVAASSAWCAGDDDDEALIGTWTVIAVEKDGKKLPEEQVKGLTVRFESSGKASGRKGDKLVFEARFKLDSTQEPKTIDATQTSDGENKGKTTLGIYEIEGDTLRTCIAEPGNDRPTEFSAKVGSGHVLRVYKRAAR